MHVYAFLNACYVKRQQVWFLTFDKNRKNIFTNLDIFIPYRFQDITVQNFLYFRIAKADRVFFFHKNNIPEFLYSGSQMLML